MRKIIFNNLVRIYLNPITGGLLFKNAENKKCFEIDSDREEFLLFLKEFTKPVDAGKILNKYKKNIEPQVFDDLMSYGFLTEFNTKKHIEYTQVWEEHNWEDFQYFLKVMGDYDFLDVNTDEDKVVQLKEKMFTEYLMEKGFEYKRESNLNQKMNEVKSFVLPEPNIKPINNFFQTVYSRRTIRNFNYQKISLQEFSFIMKYSFYELKNRKENVLQNITQNLANFTNSHSLWLNAIVCISKVEGIENGYYYYDYMSHSLKLIEKNSKYDDLQKIVIGQKFMYGSAFSIFLSVDFYNIFWRYRYNAAYKAIFISAAELVQKFIIAAGSLGLGTFETPAIRDIDAEAKFKTKPFEEEIIYFLAIGKYGKEKSYNFFAGYYDAIMGDRSTSFNHIIQLIRQSGVKPKNILDIACGTGVLTNTLHENFQNVEGVDVSTKMLNVAKSNFPKINFTEANMSDFDLGKKFDAITCNFDSVNHLTTYNKWLSFFKNAHKHLNKNGVLIFDINTLEKLQKISKLGPSVSKIGDKDFVIDVEQVDENLFNWNVKYSFEENILEAGFPKKMILEDLKKIFKKVVVKDFDLKDEKRKNMRLFFVCHK